MFKKMENNSGGGGVNTVIGTVTASSSTTTKVTLGFKPSFVAVEFYTDSTHFCFTLTDLNLDKAYHLARYGSSAAANQTSLPSTMGSCLKSIDDDGFTLNNISPYSLNGVYIAIE